MRKAATQLKHLEPNACAFDHPSHVRDTRKNVRLCQVLCIRRGVCSVYNTIDNGGVDRRDTMPLPMETPSL